MQRNIFILSIFLLTIGLTFLSSCTLSGNKNSNAEDYYNQGVNLQDYGLSDEAIPKFKKALEIASPNNPNRLFYYRNLANCFFDLGEQDSCLHYMKNALKFCPANSYEYFYIKGDILLLQDNIRKGVFNLKKACLINPDNTEANNSIGLIYMGVFGEEHTNYKKALKYNLKAFESSNSTTTKAVLASNYYWLDDLENAKKHYQELVDFNIHDLRSKYYLGLCHYESSEFKKAKPLLRDVIQLDTSYISSCKHILLELGIDFRE